MLQISVDKVCFRTIKESIEAELEKERAARKKLERTAKWQGNNAGRLSIPRWAI